MQVLWYWSFQLKHCTSSVFHVPVFPCQWDSCQKLWCNAVSPLFFCQMNAVLHFILFSVKWTLVDARVMVKCRWVMGGWCLFSPSAEVVMGYHSCLQSIKIPMLFPTISNNTSMLWHSIYHIQKSWNTNTSWLQILHIHQILSKMAFTNLELWIIKYFPKKEYFE